jgi:hypothetical protein
MAGTRVLRQLDFEHIDDLPFPTTRVFAPVLEPIIRKGYKRPAAVDRRKKRLDILLTEYSFGCILWNMSWSVEFTDEFSQWWVGLSEDQFKALEHA